MEVDITDMCDYVSNRRDLWIQSSKEFPTPQYIIDEEILNQQCNKLKEAFQSRYTGCRRYYPYKTNNIPHILKVIHSQGFGAEVSSLFELMLADKLGVKGTVFNSPGKTIEELIYAIENSAVVIIDNFDELDKIVEACEKTKREPILGVRLNLSRFNAGWWHRFGIPLGSLPQLYKELNRRDLSLAGLHFHLGSRFKNARPYKHAMKIIGGFLKKKQCKDIKEDLSFIDLGGGIGSNGSVPKNWRDYLLDRICVKAGFTRLNSLRRFRMGSVEPINSFADGICSAFQSEIIPILGDVGLWIEPGRWLVNPCVHLISQVLAVKDNSIVIDGGINILPNALHENYIVFNVSKPHDTKTPIIVYGPLCMSNDLVSSCFFGGKPDVGDVVVVVNVGAYNVSWSTQFIKPLPCVISISDGRLREVRREEDFNYRFARDFKL